jgi:hypothetical protein
MRGSGYEDHFLFLFGGVAFFRGALQMIRIYYSAAGMNYFSLYGKSK